MAFTHPVMGLSTDKQQLDERTGSDANQDVHGEPFNKHSGSDGKKTVSIYTELDELIATSERERRTQRTGRSAILRIGRPHDERNGSTEGVC